MGFLFPKSSVRFLTTMSIALFIAGVFLILNIPKAEAATIYANSATGNDANACTSNAPCQTFTRAYAVASSGDTIDLTGTFDWTNGSGGASETTSATTGFTIAKNLTIQGQGSDQTFIQAASSAGVAGRRIFTISSSYTVTFKNLDLRYGNVSNSNNGGGAVYVGSLATSANVTFDSCILENNTVSSSSYNYWFGGGAIYYMNNGSNTSGQVIIENSIIRNNSVSNGWGGAIWHYNGGSNSSIVVINNSTINNNSATYFGMALAAYYGSFNISNSTITGNTGGTTIEMGNWGYGVLYLTNVTLAYNSIGNSSSYYGLDLDQVGNVYVKNTIIAQNKTTSGVQQDYNESNSALHNNGHNIVETQSGSDFINGVNGCIVGVQAGLNLSNALASNNSLNITQTLALSSGSVAINAGSTGTNGTVSVPLTDQRGLSRDANPDIGAYEYGGSVPATAPTTQATNVSFSSVGATSTTISWTNGNGADRVVFIAQANSGTTTPIDHTTYTASTTFGSGTSLGSSPTWYAVYNGTGNSVSVAGLATNTAYIVQVFEYNGSAGGEVYNTASTTDNPKTQTTLQTHTLNYAAGSHGSISGADPQTVASGSDGSAVTAVPDTGYHFVQWSDGSIDNPRTDTNVTADVSVTANFALTDVTPPTFSSISSSSTSTGATITWATDEDSSTQVNYGLTSSYGSSTTETDISPRTTSHSATITGLLSCTRYYYQVEGADASANTGTSTDEIFTTAGCVGDASISATGQASVTAASGGSWVQGDLALTVPASFTSDASSAVFQANQLDDTAFSATAGAPSSYTQVGTDVYNLKSLSGPATAISIFNHPITIKMTYSSGDIGVLDESTFWIYRYDSPTWAPLDDCVVDTSAKTVTCTTKNFSNFAIFGQEGSCPTVEHAATYNSYPTCGPATCDSGYTLLNGSCVAAGGGLLPGMYRAPVAPAGGFSVIVDNGSATTTNRIVTLNFNAGSDVKKMAISLTSDFSDASQENYSASEQFDLCSKLGGLIKSTTCPDGQYTVYVKFYTQYGKASDAVSTKINLASASQFSNHTLITTPQFSNPAANFTKNLYLGSKDNQVKALQQFLNQNGYKLADTGWGSLGSETDYFGVLTSSALAKFQEANRNKASGMINEKGYLGPITRQFINSSTSATVSKPLHPQIQNSTPAIFTASLYEGLQSEDVRRLQTLLATRPKIYPDGLITGYFGPLTEKAVQTFQLSYGVVASSFDPGFGYVGPKTRAKLEEIFGKRER